MPIGELTMEVMLTGNFPALTKKHENTIRRLSFLQYLLNVNKKKLEMKTETVLSWTSQQHIARKKEAILLMKEADHEVQMSERNLKKFELVALNRLLSPGTSSRTIAACVYFTRRSQESKGKKQQIMKTKC